MRFVHITCNGLPQVRGFIQEISAAELRELCLTVLPRPIPLSNPVRPCSPVVVGHLSSTTFHLVSSSHTSTLPHHAVQLPVPQPVHQLIVSFDYAQTRLS